MSAQAINCPIPPVFPPRVVEMITEIDQLMREIRSAIDLRDDPEFAPNPEELRAELKMVANHPAKLATLIEALRTAVKSGILTE